MNNIIKWEDYSVPYSGHPSALNVSELNSELVIPVLILTGSGNWNINVSFQSASKQIILDGDGIIEGYTYVVRAFYLDQPW